jgi:hypothetical protein
MSQPSAPPEPATVDSATGDVEAAWQGPIEQAMVMGMMKPPLSPGMTAVREEFLAWIQAHLPEVEWAARKVRQPWVRPYFEQVRQQVAWVLDAGADDPADYLAAVREGRPWRSIGDAGLMAAIERCQALLRVASRLLARWCGIVLLLYGLAASLLTFVLTELLEQRSATPRPESDRAPPRPLVSSGFTSRAPPVRAPVGSSGLAPFRKVRTP